jgi:hypothetical protein
MIDLTILTEVLLNGIHMTIIYITILTEDLLNGVHRTILKIEGELRSPGHHS